MPAISGTALPGLSQILGWDVEHLVRTTTDFGDTAVHWEDAFDTMHRGVLSPGGAAWDGTAADAAQDRTFGDLVKVRGLANTLRDVAAIARRGADQLDYLKRRAVEAVNDARAGGFTVAKTFRSLTPASTAGFASDWLGNTRRRSLPAPLHLARPMRTSPPRSPLSQRN